MLAAWLSSGSSLNGAAAVAAADWSCQPTDQDTDPQQFRQYNTASTMVPMDQEEGPDQYRQTFGLLYH